MPTEQNAEILQAMKEAAAALRDNDIHFALAGGLACWARGGPATEHDVDFVIREEDVERALLALRKAGMRTDIPPEGAPSSDQPRVSATQFPRLVYIAADGVAAAPWSCRCIAWVCPAASRPARPVRDRAGRDRNAPRSWCYL